MGLHRWHRRSRWRSIRAPTNPSAAPLLGRRCPDTPAPRPQPARVPASCAAASCLLACWDELPPRHLAGTAVAANLVATMHAFNRSCPRSSPSKSMRAVEIPFSNLGLASKERRNVRAQDALEQERQGSTSRGARSQASPAPSVPPRFPSAGEPPPRAQLHPAPALIGVPATKRVPRRRGRGGCAVYALSHATASR